MYIIDFHMRISFPHSQKLGPLEFTKITGTLDLLFLKISLKISATSRHFL